MESKCTKLKVLVDKEKNRVILAECDHHFIDSLFECLVKPMGMIMNHNRNQPQQITIGCMNNLYASVENLDVRSFRTEACKTMLLHAFMSHPKWYYYCRSRSCICISQYRGALCNCGKPIESLLHFEGSVESKNVVSDTRDGGIFVKRQTLLILSDELKLIPVSTAATCSLLSMVGVRDLNTIEEKTFDIGVNEVLKLLKSSLVSKTPLTETLLKSQELPELSKETCDQGSCSFIKQEIGEKENGKICLTLVLSKPKKTVCYAEVGEDFINLLFSFLSIPLAYLGKEMQFVAFSKGRLNHLYQSVESLEVEKYFKTKEDKELIISPKILAGFKYENQLLDLEEFFDDNQYYCTSRYDPLFGTSRSFYIGEPSGGTEATLLKVKDPKSVPHEEATSRGSGFVEGPAMFTVTDDLIVTPFSPVSVVSNLNKLKVPLSDIEHRIVYIGKEEALRLLVASCTSKSALTETFLYKKPK